MADRAAVVGQRISKRIYDELFLRAEGDAMRILHAGATGARLSLIRCLKENNRVSPDRAA